MLEQDISVIFASVKEVTIMKTAVIYARVSSSNDRQNTQRQIEDLTHFASHNEYQLMGTYEEHISGATKNENRMVLMECINYCIEHQVNYLLLSELSRLGRDTLQVLEVIEMLNGKGISLYIQNYNIETLTKEGKVNAMSQFLITILAEVARMERKTIRERVESGYKNFRANGGKVGRKIGYQKTDEAMKEQYVEEIKLLKKGYSLRNISKLTGTSINTIRKCRNIL